MITIASFFAGVGGIDLGFSQTGVFETIYANEFDKYPAQTLEMNFPNLKVDIRDIHDVKSEEIPDTDIIVGGFPCQAFSIAGYRQGFDDVKGRGELFFELIRIIEAHRPRVAFFENVKNLVSHDNGNTFRVICEQLDILGYHYTFQVLNAMNYGNMAQNRERIYIVAFRDTEDYARFHWPLPITLNTTVRDIIDFDNPKDEKYYYTPGKYKGDIYEQLVLATQDEDINNPSVYQWRRKYVRKNKSGVVPTLTANQGEGGHNVCIVKVKDGIRKMTPRECFNTQGFPDDYILPTNQSDAKLYKQAGNSVCVPVIRRIAESIAEAIGEKDIIIAKNNIDQVISNQA
ncbi:DNA (cytosine-5)-methyltransferase 1 [Pseudobutyrivibrio sp. C4]|uniref:DNA cytosine methyltransferase n=1 Tax=Pseudobutyrivibrio sp. C4 TaxID=1520803 RepID=UPI0008B6BEB3|nr:DNA cytosine methyltransferase [Pseudobutyrivibrio sp. C4]SES89177.1 DNA (cytosine-5)-methyltransferase 1 [Pseudobutyrivibrio sp. C4]